MLVILRKIINLISGKKSKISKTIQNNYSATKPIGNLSIVDIKPVTLERPETSYKLCKAIGQTETVSQIGSTVKISDSPLYTKTKKSEENLDENNAKISKQSHDYKGYPSIYIVKNLNVFNPEYAFGSNIIDLLTTLKGLNS